jgi:deoxyribodipyrimidine photo-lyase
VNKKYNNSLVWFRRDLRDYDHAALSHALQESNHVFCIFIFDKEILNALKNKEDRRVEFIWESVKELKESLREKKSDLIVTYDLASNAISRAIDEFKIEAIYTNRDYEPQAIKRDETIKNLAIKKNIAFYDFKDQVVFEKDEILTALEKPYTVFTPYKNNYLKKLNQTSLPRFDIEPFIKNLAQFKSEPLLTLKDMGFQTTNLSKIKIYTGMTGGKLLTEDFKERMAFYKKTRDFPAIKGVSYLSVHLRFGTVSIRQLFRLALESFSEGSETWLNELIWREFYFQILFHRPDVALGNAFKKEYESIAFENNPDYFKAWTEGKTGYPIVDAAMRQLNQTGFMHNRLRMIAASFLVKDLLVDWRWGEAYFAEKLIDFDLSANNGGWQWAASTGCDAQPWFRIFNPITQSLRFDPKGKFIKKYIPELNTFDDDEIHAPWFSQNTQKIDYPKPIIDHASQRIKALALYKSAKS